MKVSPGTKKSTSFLMYPMGELEKGGGGGGGEDGHH